MKFFQPTLFAFLLCTSLTARAHDEGHGPKLTDSGKYGGLVVAVVAKKDASLGAKATLLYKAELLRSAEGKVSVYVYDAAMKPLVASGWDKKVEASVQALKKAAKAQKFQLSFDGKAFTGEIPANLAKPFNLDLVFKDKTNELLAAFDNLD